MAQTLIAHEWLAPHGGSENVFEQLAVALPGSRLRCIWNDAPQRFGDEIAESWLARTPIRRSKAAALPFLSLASRAADLDGIERVVTSSHAFAHHLATRASAWGLDSYAYVHSPARYVWVPDMDERGAGRTARAASTVLKRLDRRHTSAAVRYAANSEFVRARIRAAWGQDATVIYPPVAVERIQAVTDWRAQTEAQEEQMLAGLPEHFVLGASRLVEYKRLDLSMRAGEALGLPVVIAGAGPFEAGLKELAASCSVPVRFVGRVSDPGLYALYQRAELFVFMAVEDFGIMPVEAMAAGTPVLVNDVGGAAESVLAVEGGAAVSPDAGSTALREAAAQAVSVDRLAMAERVSTYSEASFRARIQSWVGAA
jgi:glycosyltransferase involved in cell wall biosynthesis